MLSKTQTALSGSEQQTAPKTALGAETATRRTLHPHPPIYLFQTFTEKFNSVSFCFPRPLNQPEYSKELPYEYVGACVCGQNIPTVANVI